MEGVENWMVHTKTIKLICISGLTQTPRSLVLLKIDCGAQEAQKNATMLQKILIFKESPFIIVWVDGDMDDQYVGIVARYITLCILKAITYFFLHFET